MARLSSAVRFKLRVITIVGAVWLGVVLAIMLWPKFPVGNCPDSPPDTAYVCRVGYNDDYDRAVTRRDLLVGLETGILLGVGAILWLLQQPGETLLSGRPITRRQASTLSSNESSRVHMSEKNDT
ncbi:MAG: hypothetical protein C4318_04580 [Acidimicrobiia bacterium]